MRRSRASRRRLRAARWAGRIGALILTAVLLSLLLSWLIETWQKRTVIVGASSSRVSLTVREDQALFMLGEAVLCLPRATPRRPRDYPMVMTCDEGAWFAVRPGDALPPASEVPGAGWPEGSIWPRTVVLDPPPGTRIDFEIVDDYAEIRFAALPDGLRQMPGVVAQARMIMPTAAMQDRGRYLVRAELELGTPPGTSQRGYVKSGDITFRAATTLTFGWEGRANILLREDRIPVGGHVKFVDMRDRTANPMNVQVIANASDGSFDVQAVNVRAPTAAILQYVGTEPLRLVPLWMDLIIKDPFISLLSVLAGLMGFGALANIGRRRDRQGRAR